ncbi:MAG: methyl-accepting chemotaxis protein [Gammaproteobacteria bacterium]|nr:methyl-accepting chemotaxis protein [Gammaproteobacteria bacterium]
MSIRFKFNLAMFLVFALGFAGATFLIEDVLLQNAKDEVALKARIMMEAARSMRSYTVEEIRPLLRQIKTDEFLSQTVPAYAATANMNRLRNAYPDYSYKEAALNPTNPEHKANAWEEDIIQYFRNYQDVKEYTGVRSTPTGQYMFLGRPFKITKQGCLACHGNPEMAPPSMLKKYGRNNGFGWKHNEIIGAQIVNVPMTIPIERADRTFYTFMIILGGVFLVIWLVMNLLLHLIIIKRINLIAEKSSEISQGDMTVAEFDKSGKDELSSLGHSFNLMYRSLSSAVKLLDKSQV